MTKKNTVIIICLLVSPAYMFYISRQPGYYSHETSPPICPKWAYAHWIWEDNGNTRGSLMELVHGYESHNIPVKAIIIDSPWQTAYTTSRPDSIRYPNFEVR